MEVTGLAGVDSCEVCGQTMHKQFLQPWNDKEVCRPCIILLEEEAERYYSKVENQ